MTSLVTSIVLGLVAGVIPVYLGLIPLPVFRRMSALRKDLLLNFSIGVLLFLFVDVTSQATSLARLNLQGPLLFTLGLTLGLAAPAYVSHRKRTTINQPSIRSENEGKLLNAYMIAIGIGLHNFGEGLALGAAYAAGQFALTSVLLVGFALHNGTEGMGISGPITKVPLNAREPVVLGFVAGVPTMVGSVIGTIAYSDLVGVLFFSAAGGALLYVTVELLKMSKVPWSTFTGIAVGILLMYLTDLLLSA